MSYNLRNTALFVGAVAGGPVINTRDLTDRVEFKADRSFKRAEIHALRIAVVLLALLFL